MSQIKPTFSVTDVAIKPMLNTEQAAAMLGLSPATLEKDRSTRTLGVPFVKIGRSVSYRLADLEAFIAKRVVV